MTFDDLFYRTLGFRPVCGDDESNPQPRSSGEGLEDDFVLMEGIARRDAGALGRLYDRHRAVVYSLCLRILRDPGLAEDALIDVFAEVWERAERYRPGRGTPFAPGSCWDCTRVGICNAVWKPAFVSPPLRSPIRLARGESNRSRRHSNWPGNSVFVPRWNRLNKDRIKVRPAPCICLCACRFSTFHRS